MPLTVHDFGGGTFTVLNRWPNSNLRPMNPSIVSYHGKLLMFVRLIEGDIDDNERYTLYRDYNSWIGVVELSEYTFEPIAGTHQIVQVSPDIGPKIEDVRAFVRGDCLHLMGARLQHNDERTWFSNDMVVFCVKWEMGTPFASAVEFLPRRWAGSREKNWTPTVSRTEQFDYIVDPSRVFHNGDFREFDVDPKHVSALHGGTQAVPIKIGDEDCWLTIAHQQLLLDDDYQSWKYHSLPVVSQGKHTEPDQRMYSYYPMLYPHYVVIYNEHGRLQNIGRPFFFDKPMVEFAAGILEDYGTYIVSYGSLDRESKIALLPKWRLLDYSFPYTGLDWRV